MKKPTRKDCAKTLSYVLHNVGEKELSVGVGRNKKGKEIEFYFNGDFFWRVGKETTKILDDDLIIEIVDDFIKNTKKALKKANV